METNHDTLAALKANIENPNSLLNENAVLRSQTEQVSIDLVDPTIAVSDIAFLPVFHWYVQDLASGQERRIFVRPFRTDVIGQHGSFERLYKECLEAASSLFSKPMKSGERLCFKNTDDIRQFAQLCTDFIATRKGAMSLRYADLDGPQRLIRRMYMNFASINQPIITRGRTSLFERTDGGTGGFSQDADADKVCLLLCPMHRGATSFMTRRVGQKVFWGGVNRFAHPETGKKAVLPPELLIEAAKKADAHYDAQEQLVYFNSKPITGKVRLFGHVQEFNFSHKSPHIDLRKVLSNEVIARAVKDRLSSTLDFLYDLDLIGELEFDTQ